MKYIRAAIISAGVILLIIPFYIFYNSIFLFLYKPTRTQLPQGITTEHEVIEKRSIEIIAENLRIPWAVAFLPDGNLLVTERPGTLRKIGKDGKIYNIEGVHHSEEGGLLGMALHPRFTENHWIYLYLTITQGSEMKNRIERYAFENDQFADKKIIIENIPGALYHDGGRIAFGPDGYLYITTGDAGKSNLAQAKDSLAGKILRLDYEGAVPSDNPFNNAVWSYGHRNSQGLAWDDRGRLWATEHGRSGILSGFDELNLIEKGKNYGWPVIQGNETRAGMESPVTQSGPDETWAPAGALFWDDSIFFAGLRGEAIYEARIGEEKEISLKIHFHNEFGRLRDIVRGPDDFFYVTTSNTDDRGMSRPGDDKIIRIDPKVFR
ncbi:MAG: PQQ-dependent sugar dehydrogenase [Patescibacteria group bacterium]|mgnify:FL=1